MSDVYKSDVIICVSITIRKNFELINLHVHEKTNNEKLNIDTGCYVLEDFFKNITHANVI